MTHMSLSCVTVVFHRSSMDGQILDIAKRKDIKLVVEMYVCTSPKMKEGNLSANTTQIHNTPAGGD